MRLSRLFGKTLREAPSGAQMMSHQLLVRAGMIQIVAPGLYGYLPLGWRALDNIERVIREEMESIGGQEIVLPNVRPAELREETSWAHGRESIATRPGSSDGGLPALGPSYQETIIHLARREIDSYRQLPVLVYHTHSQFRDQPRPTMGLMGAREYFAHNGYSLHPTRDDLDAFYERVFQAYQRAFQRCQVAVQTAEGDPGPMADVPSDEFVALHDSGKDGLFICNHCGYSANAQIAAAAWQAAVDQPPASLEKVATPDATTIAELASYLDVPAYRTLKTLFYAADGELVLVVIRGDLEVNEARLAHLLRAGELRLADEEESRRAGIVAGYASPVGQSAKLRVVGDESIKSATNFVAGANEAGYHLRNVNYPRDFSADVIGEFASVRDGDPCANCGTPLRSVTGIKLAHLRKPATGYSDRLAATFLDSTGRPQPLVMGCYSMDLGSLLCALVEQHHDERGIIWPPLVAPYHVHLISLGGRPEIAELSEAVYEDLASHGFEVLYDDRDENPGVKFNDADLVGIPLRLTVGSRSLSQGGIEVKRRTSAQGEVVPIPEVPERIQRLMERSGPGTAGPRADRH